MADRLEITLVALLVVALVATLVTILADKLVVLLETWKTRYKGCKIVDRRIKGRFGGAKYCSRIVGVKIAASPFPSPRIYLLSGPN